ncbi:MAG: hypothetical protein IKQ70_05085 [Bacteroidales bacterium]|nr:hypothetical protein [Bacteroidales bacterium]
MTHRMLALFLSIAFTIVVCGFDCNEPNSTTKSGTHEYAICNDASGQPDNDALLKLLYPNDPKARLDYCNPILVDGKKYFFVRASHGFFSDGQFYYGFIDHHFVTSEGGTLKADFSITDTDTTFYGNEVEFESNAVQYSLEPIGKSSVALKMVLSANNQGFMESNTLFLVEIDRITQIFDIESSFDNAMWFPDNPTVYSNEVKIIETQNDMYDILVTHKTYEVLFKGEDLDYDTKVEEQDETTFVYSSLERKYVEK